MKKGGKKWRSLQKEAAERKVNIKSKEVFVTKERNQRYFCKHYNGYPGYVDYESCGIELCHSTLIPYGEDNYICSVCKKIFSVAEYKQMERFIKYLNENKGNLTDANYITGLYRGLEPVYYSQIKESEPEILETLDNWDVMKELSIFQKAIDVLGKSRVQELQNYLNHPLDASETQIIQEYLAFHEYLKDPLDVREVQELQDYLESQDSISSSIQQERKNNFSALIKAKPYVRYSELFGGEVLSGAFKGCKIIRPYDMEYIMVDSETLIPLSKGNHVIYRKFDPTGGYAYRHYYVFFKDGSKSYIRVIYNRHRKPYHGSYDVTFEFPFWEKTISNHDSDWF